MKTIQKQFMTKNSVFVIHTFTASYNMGILQYKDDYILLDYCYMPEVGLF